MGNKIMQRMNKPFDLHTTLIIIYLALVAVSIALYALIQIFVDDKSTASNLLGWSATIFATIALLYTFNSWRNQKASDVIANEAKNVAEKMNLQLDTHRGLLWTQTYDKTYELHLDRLADDYKLIERKLNFLDSLVKVEYSSYEFNFYVEKKNSYLSEYMTFKGSLTSVYLFKSNDIKDLSILGDIDINEIAENYANAHLKMYEILIKICMHKVSIH
ncbi:hypothetical protein A4220_02825 [Acinetobacter pittii]|nr:hypothetical protein A4220_02825 [Acinetobacter pittii]